MSLNKETKINQDITDVAILLPISGEKEGYYNQLGQMIKLGLQNGSSSKIRVSLYDSSTKKTLYESIRRLIANNTQLVIGPVHSEAVSIVKTKLARRQIPIISLSNNPVNADNNVFIMGHAPMKQMNFLVDELLKSKHSNYILMLPAGHYSQTITSILRNKITENGAVFARVEYYQPSEEDISRVVKIVSDTVDNLNEMDTVLRQPVVILADDDKSLSLIYHYLDKYSLDQNAVIAGDGRINVRPSQKFNITYTGVDNKEYRKVQKNISKMNIEHIDFLFEIAYDAGYLVAKSIGSEFDLSNFLENMHNSKFDGLSGQVWFTDSIAQRNYKIVRRVAKDLRNM